MAPKSKERRKFRRERLRVACDFEVGDRPHAGIATDISARGLFIQTTFLPEVGAAIQVKLHDSRAGPISVIGRVARQKRSHRGAAAVERGGFGVEIVSADDAFFQLLLEMGLG